MKTQRIPLTLTNFIKFCHENKDLNFADLDGKKLDRIAAWRDAFGYFGFIKLPDSCSEFLKCRDEARLLLIGEDIDQMLQNCFDKIRFELKV